VVEAEDVATAIMACVALKKSTGSKIMSMAVAFLGVKLCMDSPRFALAHKARARTATQGGGEDCSAAVAKSDRSKSVSPATGSIEQGVAILQKDTGLPGRELNRIATAVGDFQQAASAVRRWAGQCAGAEQITRLKVAAA